MNINLSYETKYKETENYLKAMTILTHGEDVIGKCIITLNDNIWTISSWYIDKKHQHNGYGTAILKKTVNDLYEKAGEPLEIQYIWNGMNDYVMDWLNKYFTPISTCPLSVQKNSADDDWSSHIYKLNKDCFLSYFNLGLERDEK